MAKIGVTYEQVASAANELSAKNKRPTLEAVRRILGTGSNSTLVKHLSAWRTTEEGAANIVEKEKIPEALVIALKSVWDQVVEQSNHRINKVEDESQKAIATIKQELLQLQQANNLLQQQQHQLKQERDSLAQDKSALNHFLNEAKTELATLNEKLAGADRQNHEKQERIAELQRQHQQVQANLEHYREASLAQRQEDQRRYEQQISQLNYTIQSINTENLALKKENAELQQRLGVIDFENNDLKGELEKIEAEHQQKNLELHNVQINLAKRSQDVETLQKQLFDLQEKQNSSHAVIIDLQTKEAVSSQQVLQLQKELKEMRDQNQVLAHEKLVLTQEKAQLYGQLKQLELRK